MICLKDNCFPAIVFPRTLYIQHSACLYVPSVPMFSSPLLSLTDAQVDVLGSPFPPSPLFLQSPQPSQISPLLVQSPRVDSFWHEPLFGANFFAELEVPPFFLDNDVVNNLSVSLDHRRLQMNTC